VVEVADLLRARSLPGRHNWQNAAAAYAAARAMGVPAEEAADDGWPAWLLGLDLHGILAGGGLGSR